MNLLRIVDFVFKPQMAYAHCDIPCGIYETNTLMVAAQTIVRMVEVLEALPEKKSLNDKNTLVRCIKVKEEHAQLAKQQLFILWGDFFKPEHFEKWPDLHDKILKAVKLCSDNKHVVSMDKANELIEAVGEINDIFNLVKTEPKTDISGAISDNPASPMKKLLGE